MSFTKHDVSMYKEDAILGLLGFKNTKHIFDVKIQNVEPIKIKAGKSVLEDILKDTNNKTIKEAYEYLNDKKYFDDTTSVNERFNIWSKDEKAENSRKKLGSYVHKKVYKDREGFSQNYKEQGYDAIIDPEDLVWNYEKPLIVTNNKKFKVTDIKEIPDSVKKKYSLN